MRQSTSLGYYAKCYRIAAQVPREKYITGKKLLKLREHVCTYAQVLIRARTNASRRNLQINAPVRIFFRVTRVSWRAPGSGFVFFPRFFCFLSCPCVIRDNKIFRHVYLTKIHFPLFFTPHRPRRIRQLLACPFDRLE